MVHEVPPTPGGEADMNGWWWVPIGLAVWLGVSLTVALFVAPVLRRSTQAREALDVREGETPAEPQEPPEDGPRVA
jgi:hypothetical protein